MGNELCEAVSKQEEYKRMQFIHDLSAQHKGDTKVPSSSLLSRTNSQISPSQQKQSPPPPDHQTIIQYRQHIIKCHPSSLRYQKLPSPQQRIPIINGEVQVYKKSNPTEIVYKGEMRNSKFNGFGKLYRNDNKLAYEGEFKNNLYDGWGVTEEYSGEWREGLYDGYGVYREFQNGEGKVVTFYYEGYFQNGLYSGSGVLIKSCKWPVSEVDKVHSKQGVLQYLNDQIQYGMEIIKVYKAKEVYIGQFSNGFRHGFGRLFNEDMEFSGQFSHNLYHGLGTIYNNVSKGKRVIQAVFKMGKEFKG